MRCETLLYNLKHKNTGSVHRVMVWTGYGAVCPTLWTTNGAYGTVAQQTIYAIKSGHFEVCDSQIDADFSDQASLEEAIKKVIVEIKAKGKW